MNWRNWSRRQRIIVGVLVLLLVVGAINAANKKSSPPPTAATSTSSSTDTSSSASSTGSDTSTPAQRLALLQAGAGLPVTDPLVRSFDRLLTALKPVCTQNSERVAALTWATWKDLQKNNRPVSLLHVLQALNTAAKGVPAKGRPTDCGALLAAYATLAETPGHTA